MNVLFVCTENAGRSQIAEHLFNASAKGFHEARSAGTRPARALHATAIEALRLRGVDASGAKPKAPTPELMEWADRVITMGCGDECPVTGKPTEDWELPDVAGASQEDVEEITVQIAKRLSKLLKELQVPAWA